MRIDPAGWPFITGPMAPAAALAAAGRLSGRRGLRRAAWPLIGAIILSPPFPSGTPLALGVLAGVLAPAGPLVGTALVGSRDADAPGLRRLDSLILLGPAWAWWATTLIR